MTLAGCVSYAIGLLMAAALLSIVFTPLAVNLLGKLAIAIANFPQQKLTQAAILLYLILSAIVSIPYMAWRKRRQFGATGGAPIHRNPSRSL